MSQMHKYTDILRQLKDIMGDFYITGSLSLSLNGDITRDVSDLDLIVTNKEALKRLEKSFELKYIVSYVDKTAEEMEEEEKRYNEITKDICTDGGFTQFTKNLAQLIMLLDPKKRVPTMAQFYVGKTKVDAFIRDEEYDYTLVTDDFTGNQYKVADSKYAFKAKQEIVNELKGKGIKNLTEKQAKDLAKHLLDLWCKQN